MPDLLELLTGVVSGVAGLVLPRVLRSTDDASLVGTVVLAALMVGTGLAPVAVLVAVALIAGGVAGLGADLGRVPQVVWVGSIAGGVVLLGLAMPTAAPDWFAAATMVAVVVVLILAAAAWSTFSPLGTGWLIAVAAAAAYGAVPDTEQITAVAGAWGIIVVGLTLTRRPPSAAGLALAAALTVWAISAGAAGREAALVSLGGFGVLAAAPLWWLLRRRLRWWSFVGVLVGLGHLVSAVTIARGPALGADLSDAAATAAVVMGWAVALAVLALPSGQRWADGAKT